MELSNTEIKAKVNGYGKEDKMDTGQIQTLIQNDSMSQRKRQAQKGQDYYDGLHDIKNYTLYYYDKFGQKYKAQNRTNTKISHPFFQELVEQTVQHFMSSKESFVKSSIPELQKELDKYFGKSFRQPEADLLRDMCICGFGYLYAYESSRGRLAFQHAPTLGVVECRETGTTDAFSQIIYYFDDQYTDNNERIRRISVWDKEGVQWYEQVGDSGAIKPTGSKQPHVVMQEQTPDGQIQEYGETLGFIPFFRADWNRKQTSQLHLVKDLIDDYDLMACGLSNNLTDLAEGYILVKGANVGDGETIQQLLASVRGNGGVGVPTDGDMDIRTVNIPYEARKAKLEIDEKNIYRAGMGFNSSQVGDGNITNIVIKSRYTLLELKCNRLEEIMTGFLLKQIIPLVLDEINDLNGTGYTIDDVDVEFKRILPTNESDTAATEKTKAETEQIRINTLLNVAALVGNEEIVRKICEYLDIDYEKVKNAEPTLDELSEALNEQV